MKSLSQDNTPSAASRLATDPSRFIRRIIVDQSVIDVPFARRILNRVGDIPVTVVPEDELPPPDLGAFRRDMIAAKQTLVLTRNRGRFLKPCPATREYRCCDYQVLNIGMNCPMDCVYCILQAYLNAPTMSVFVNIDDLLAELDQAATDGVFRRIGTGEFTDSLALDRLTGLSSILVEYFRDKQNMVLELKSKAVVIDNLEGLDHNGRTIIAWSLNSPAIMRGEELRTSSLDQRLAAAARCAAWGYRLAFHFDPIIFHDTWQQGYSETIERLFAAVPAERIAWISMGALRFLPDLKEIAFARFPGSKILAEEFVPGLDGKLRYFRPQRVEMYRHIYGELQQRAAPGTCIYLCMESDEIWRDVFGFTPEDRGGLPAMLDRAVTG